MKKIITLTLVVIMSFFLVSCGSTTNGSNYTAYFGEQFYLPNIDDVSFEVQDSEGNSLEIVNSSFVPVNMSDHKLIIKKGNKIVESKIEIIDRRLPVISTSYDFKYALAGEVELPQVKADNSTIKINVMSGDTEILFTDNEFFAESGRYDIEITATNQFGNQSKKVCYIQITDNENKLNTVTAFEEPYGLKHFDRRYSLTPTYILKDDLKPTIEAKRIAFNSQIDYKGLTQLYYTSEQVTSIKGKILLKDFLISDITGYNGMYFYVYHDTQLADNSPSLIDFKAWILLNETNSIELKPNDWTKVEIANLNNLVSNSGIVSYQENFDLKDINGLLLSINNSTLSEERGFFFTDFYLY